jgi:hypothetical protein
LDALGCALWSVSYIIDCGDVQSKQVDLGKLAMHFTLDNPNIASTLVSTASLSRLMVGSVNMIGGCAVSLCYLQTNLACCHESLTELEVEVTQELRQKFFE